MGALLGPGKSMKAGFGMFMLGAGIGGFFAGLAAGDSAASYLNADGVAIKNIMVNLAEGLGAFAGKDLASLYLVLYWRQADCWVRQAWQDQPQLALDFLVLVSARSLGESP